MAAAPLSAEFGVVTLRLCKRLPHDCAAGRDNRQSICVSIPWSNRLPSIYRSLGRDILDVGKNEDVEYFVPVA